MHRYSLLFVIDIHTRRLHPAGVTRNPDGPWVAQKARNRSITGAVDNVRFLIRDRDTKFTTAFDDVCQAGDVDVLQAPFRTLQANGHAEHVVRFIPTNVWTGRSSSANDIYATRSTCTSSSSRGRRTTVIWPTRTTVAAVRCTSRPVTRTR